MTPLLRRASLAAALALAAACGRVYAPAAAGSGGALQARAEASDFSAYELGSTWRDQDGHARALPSLAGKVRVLALVYTHCAHTCPEIVGELKRIEAALPPADRARAGFVLVSLDPRRDTPARLREYAASLRLDPARWTLLTGDEDGVRELAALLGIRYRPEGAEDFSHTNAYLILDKNGRVVYRQDTLDGDPDEPLARIRAAVSAPPAAAPAAAGDG